MSLQEIQRRYEEPSSDPDERTLEEKHDELAEDIVWLSRRLRELKEESKLVKLWGESLTYKLIGLRRREREEARERQLRIPGMR